MFAEDGMFEPFFGALGLLIAAFGIGMLVLLVRKGSENRRILREGLVAEARCLETFMVHHRSSDGAGRSQRRLILGFRASDGREVRTEIAADVPYVVGDIVPVRYLPERPERVVPAGASPGLGFATCVAGGVALVFTFVGVFFAVTAFGLVGSMDTSVEEGGTTPDFAEYSTTEP